MADRAAAIYAPVVHLLALAAFLGWIIVSGDMRLSINIAIAVLIITCPCALGLAVPAVSTAAVSRLFSAGFLVKHATALERLAEVDYIVFDKTGTLTLPSVAVPDALGAQDRAVLKSLAQASHHPMSKALVKALGDTEVADLRAITEVAGEGIMAQDDAQAGAQTVRLGRGAWLGADFTGLGFQRGTDTPIELHATEALRPGVREAIAALGLPCEVITGDAEVPAQKLAAELGLHVTSNARPADKLRRLEELKAEGYHVLMVGDGLNDTAALAAAYASIAPATALDASRSTSDIVVLKESFEDLPLILKVSRATKRLSQQNFRISTIYNLVSVPLALLGFCTPLAAALSMSISSITVILNAQRMRWIS
jgi:Cu2+-exporting ATPase